MPKPVIFGLDQLLHYIDKCNCIYFKIVVSDSEADKKGSCLLTNYEKENQSIEDVRREVLDYCDTIKFRGGDFTIWLSNKPKTSTPEFRQNVEIPPAFINQNISGPGIGNYHSQGGNIQEMIQDAVNKALDAQKKEWEIHRLQKELEDAKKELRESQPGAFERVIGRLEPYVPMFIKTAFPMNAEKAASAVSGESPSIGEDEVQKIAEEALIRLAKIYPEDLHLLLQKLANLAEANPSISQML
jgi:hypothetical protein